MRFHRRIISVVLVAIAALSGSAQTAADPTDPAAPIHESRYGSAFAGYQAWQEQQPGDWRQNNDEMARIGGHAGHLKGSLPAADTEPRKEGGHHD